MGFDDPPRLAKNSQNEEDALKHFRRVRDELKVSVEKLPQILKPKNEDMVFDQTRFIADLQSVLSQYPKNLKDTKKS